jgi:hypothetical protein
VHVLSACIVQTIGSFVPPAERKDTCRSLVRLSVPIFVPRDDAAAREAAKVIVRGAFAKAISTGEFDGF